MIASLLFALQAVAAPPEFTAEQKAFIVREMARLKQLKSLTDEQAMIIYDQCIAREGASLSHTDLPDDTVFPQARARCSSLRADLLNGSTPARFAQFKKYNDDKEAAFPGLTRKVREQRRQFESGKSDSADNQ